MTYGGRSARREEIAAVKGTFESTSSALVSAGVLAIDPSKLAKPSAQLTRTLKLEAIVETDSSSVQVEVSLVRAIDQTIVINNSTVTSSTVAAARPELLTSGTLNVSGATTDIQTGLDIYEVLVRRIGGTTTNRVVLKSVAVVAIWG